MIEAQTLRIHIAFDRTFGIRNCLRTRLAQLGSVVPRPLECSRPKADAFGARGGFVRSIAVRVTHEGDCVAMIDHPSAQIDDALAADRNWPPILVCISLRTGDGSSADQVIQGPRRLPAAAIRCPLRVCAGLSRLGRINAVKTNPDPINLECVPINDGRETR